MYTSILLVALSGAFAQPGGEETLEWQSDYSAAQKQGIAEKKPLAIFVGSGEAGWSKVARGGDLGKENKRLLAKDYICVYADTTTAAGKRIAAAFEITGDRGLAISSRSGDYQAFHHIGDLTQRDLAWYLVRYADPNHVVQYTESHAAQRVSNYPPAQPNPPVQYQPFIGGFGGGRSC